VCLASRLEHAIEHRTLTLPAEQLLPGCRHDHPVSTGVTDYGFPGFDRQAEEATVTAVTAARKGGRLTTAIIGVGNIGSALARHLVGGGEPVVVAAKHKSRAEALAEELGPLARAASAEDAIAGADVVVFAVWLDTIKELIARDARLLENKVVVDPSNPVGFDEDGQMTRTLPNEQSAGALLAGLLPPGAHYVKAFGTLGADSLARGANRRPRRAVLFYATDDDAAAAAVERLISAAGFDPLKAAGVAGAGRIEAPGGDLHQHGGLNGRLLDLHEARAAITATERRPDLQHRTYQKGRAVE
jgi:8-hydroxy-5-deazaflavin:NADPH oxidoreductase